MKEHSYSTKQFVITGAANGIGKALAEEARAARASVLGIDRQQTAETVIGDITDKDSLSEIAQALQRSHTQIDYLLLSAGVTQKHPGAVDTAEWQRVHKVNAEGTANSFMAFKDLLVPQATVVFLSSDLIYDPQPTLPAYAASKKAIAQFAYEQSSNYPQLRLLTLLPGPVDTQLFRWQKPVQVADKIIHDIGLQPNEFARIVLEDILPDKTKYETGSQIRIYKDQTEVIPFNNIPYQRATK